MGGRLSPPQPDFARIENQRHNLLLFVPSIPSIFGPSATPATRLIMKIFFLVRFFIILSTDFMLLVHKIIGIFCYCFSPTSTKPQLFCHIYKFLCMSYILKKQETRINLTSAIQYFTTPLYF